jgi:nucleoside-diphosphate-sugar epimerase
VRVLVTGHCGLVGRALGAVLREAGIDVRGLDLRGEGDARGDVRDREAVARAAEGCDGIVHLAAVSRVIDGERDPARCESVNVDGTRTVLDATRVRWFVFASSREVYGQAARLPVAEGAPLLPMNVYGRAKVAGEELTDAARARGLATAVVRLSNVYGSADDHADRVVPAFARAAARGLPLRVDGRDHLFDFVHLSDAAAGLAAVIRRIDDSLPPIHLVTGRGTTLGELATLAVELGGGRSSIVEAPPRSYDVSRFTGDPTRAAERLGWRARVTLREGLACLVHAFE